MRHRAPVAAGLRACRKTKPMIYFLIALFVGPLLVSMYTRGKFQTTYEESQKVKGAPELTGAGVARRILEASKITDVEIVEHWGLLPDFYDPAKKRLRLSRPHFRGTSAAAYGIAAHEAGHAIQHRAMFGALRLRISAIKVSQYLSPFVFLLPVAAILAHMVSGRIGVMGMFVAWAAVLGFNLFTLPVEYDATERSREVMDRERMFRDSKQEKAIYRMMRAAPFMYVSGFLNTIKWLISCLMPGRGKG